MRYHFKFLGEPKPKGRPKFFRRGKFAAAYTPRETREAEQDIKNQLILKLKELDFTKPLETALYIKIVVTKLKPKSARKRALPTKRPDLDNYVKLVLDAMNGLVFVDDAQIVSLEAQKEYGEQPGTLVIIEELW